MIRFLRAVELPDYTEREGIGKKQIAVGLFQDDVDKAPGTSLMKELAPMSALVTCLNMSSKSDKEYDAFAHAYADQLELFTTRLVLAAVVNLERQGFDINFVVNTGQMCKVCMDALVTRLCKLTPNVEVLV